MSKKTIIASQAIALAAAGKLAVQSTAVSAEDALTSGSKLGAANEYEANPNTLPPRMRMDQFCTPLDVCMPPTDDFVGDFDSGDFSGGKFGSGEPASSDGGGKTGPDEPVDDPQYFAANGVIFAGDVGDFSDGGPRPKIDFIISNVPNKTLDIFLLYSDRPFGKKAPGQFDGKVAEDMPEDQAFMPMFENPEGRGKLGIPLFDAAGNLDPNLKFITGVRIEPQKPIPGFDADGNGEFDLVSPLGKPSKHLRTVVLSVYLDKLTDMVQSGQVPHNVFFQAAAFPTNEDGSLGADFKKVIYSDVDQFIIEIPGDEGEGDTGTKGGGVSSNIDSNTGSKSSDSSSGGKTSDSGTSTGDSSSGGKTSDSGASTGDSNTEPTDSSTGGK